jgi:hypothetical protein
VAAIEAAQLAAGEIERIELKQQYSSDLGAVEK